MSGFTQVELVVVIVLLGILVATFGPRWADSGFDDRRLRDDAIAALRFAQKSAIAGRLHTCAAFAESTHMVVHRDTNSSTSDCTTNGPALTGPDGNPLEVTARRSASFSGFPAGWIVFDPLGRPTSGAASIAVANLPAALNITIEQETGYVH